MSRNDASEPRDMLREIDFAELYRAQCRVSGFGSRSSADWDRRAAKRRRQVRDSDYNEALLGALDFAGVRTALDIGCGTGNLAIPLARRLEMVHALDFSPEMLRQLERERQRAGLENIVAHQRSWEEPWTGVPKVDLVICSRALGVEDLRAALEKMTGRARRRCAATIHAEGDYLGADVRELLGRRLAPRPSYLYAVNILHQMGRRATVEFIPSEGGSTYASADEFVAAVRWRVGELSAAEERRLRGFYAGLPEAEGGGRKYRHDFVWALLRWEAR
ncbi:MAG: methyltransferase domain-containing protein [Lentisphaerae bacterium]|nr:methyltransferase domain-containing protein [Lentisphaerota bacterium]